MEIDYRIPHSAVEGMNDSSLFWAVIEKAWPDTEHPGATEKLHSCTPGQRALFAITLFIREVDNGGLEQFFRNTSGDLTAAVVYGFDLLGAPEKAAIVKQAMAFFGIIEPLPDWSARRRLVKAKSKAEIEAFIEPLNAQLYGEAELWPLFRRYLTLHPEDFFVGPVGR